MKINDRVKVILKDKPDEMGVILDFKWNLILIKFNDGSIDWVDPRFIKT